MEKKKMRSSNIELLRIVAMGMIILYHISFHCVRYQLVNKSSIEELANGYFCYPVFFRKLFLIEGMMPFGMIANAIFILISGYFMVEKGKEISLGNIAQKLLLQVGFAAVLLTVGSTFYYHWMRPDLETQISLRKITEFNSMNWFVGYYFAVMVIAALFLNSYLDQLREKQYRNFLLTILGIVSLSWSGLMLDGLAKGLRTLVGGVFLYALGGYIRRYDPFGKIRAWALIALVLGLNLLIFISYYNAVTNKAHSYLMDLALQGKIGTAVEPFIQPIFKFENFGLIPILIAVVMLELFRRIDLPNSHVINLLAKATFLIYLIHDNGFWRCLWKETDWMQLLDESPFLYCMKLLRWMECVFFVGFLAYLAYEGICLFCRKNKHLVLKNQYEEEETA